MLYQKGEIYKKEELVKDREQSRYETILLDADDTLFDFNACENEALRLTFQKYNYSFNVEIKEIYEKINKDLWRRYELGEVDRNTVIYSRFGDLFKKIGVDDDGIAFEDDYQELLGKQCFLIPGAMDLLHHLQKKYEVYIVTNGVTRTQYSRLQASGVINLVRKVFVSEETGYQKPMKEYFDYCFERIDKIDLDKTLIIGDSLSSDILGGNNANIKTCWLNPRGIANTLKLRIDHEIRSLEELYEVL